MGWWGNMLTENDNYQSEARLLLSRSLSLHLVILDAHI
jgi:hypothetical protein